MSRLRNLAKEMVAEETQERRRRRELEPAVIIWRCKSPGLLAKALPAIKADLAKAIGRVQAMARPSRAELLQARREKFKELSARASALAQSGEINAEQAYHLDRALDAHARRLWP